MKKGLKMRALERSDLRFIHELNNNRNIMAYWFEEPYESYDELEELYRKHIHDDAERRFVVEDADGILIGLVELIEINYIHRSAEFQIIIAHWITLSPSLTYAKSTYWLRLRTKLPSICIKSAALLRKAILSKSTSLMAAIVT